MTISRSRASMTATAAATSRASHAARSPSARRARSSARRFVIRALTSTASKGFCRKSVALERLAAQRPRLVRGHHDDRHVGEALDLPRRPDEADPVHARHIVIGDRDADLRSILGDEGERLVGPRERLRLAIRQAPDRLRHQQVVELGIVKNDGVHGCARPRGGASVGGKG